MGPGQWTDSRPLPQPVQHNEAVPLDLFTSLGSGWASLEACVENTWTSIGTLLPISESEENLGGKQPVQARSRVGRQPAAARDLPSAGNMLYASNSGMTFTSGRRHESAAVHSASSGSDSPLPSSHSGATTVARFGGAADSYKSRRGQGQSRSGTPRMDSATKQQVATDGSIKFTKARDACDKATRSKIDRWMSTARPADVNIVESVEAEPVRTFTPFGF